MDIKPLRYFVVLAETLHFGRAAARLHLSQPPLSRQIMALEDSIGVKLFERNQRRVSLTAAGERFYADACSILSSVEQATSNARAAAAGELGQLSVGFTMCAACSVVPRYARAFRTAQPRVKLQLREVVSNDLADKVVDGRIDAAIMFPGKFPHQLMSRNILTEPLCVALPHRHARARARRLHIKQLAGDPFVLASADVAPTLRAAIVGHCQRAGFDPNIHLEVQLQQTVLSLVAEGVGVALVPASMRKLRFEGVVFCPLVEAPMIEQVLVWSRVNANPCLASFLAVTDKQ